VKTRFVASGQQLLRLDEEEARAFDQGGRAELATRAGAAARTRRGSLSDYAKGRCRAR
jgi:bifunctional ADP-heptose synthase (sugar kinase/adenylyltransferase)